MIERICSRIAGRKIHLGLSQIRCLICMQNPRLEPQELLKSQFPGVNLTTCINRVQGICKPALCGTLPLAGIITDNHWNAILHLLFTSCRKVEAEMVFENEPMIRGGRPFGFLKDRIHISGLALIPSKVLNSDRQWNNGPHDHDEHISAHIM